MIQKNWKKKNIDFMYKLFEKIKNNLNEIICDQFGNYAVQKFVECICVLDKTFITKILEKIKMKLVYISTIKENTENYVKQELNSLKEIQEIRNKIKISLNVCEKVLDNFSNLIFVEVNYY